VTKTVYKASGFKDYSSTYWINEKGKYGCRYQCKACGKITLGLSNAENMHFTTCPKHPANVTLPAAAPAATPAVDADDNDDDNGFVARQVARGTPLRAGHVVYRVVEVDPPPDDPSLHTWKAEARVVERASVKQVKLEKAFSGLSKVVFDPDAFGRLFFESPLQAIQHFLIERRFEVESLDRKRKEADRAIAWAEGQPGIKAIHDE